MSQIYIDSIAALIVVKQLWRKRNFVPERLGDPGGAGPRSSTSQEKGAGPGSPIFSVFPPLFRPQKTSGRAHPFATFWGRVDPRSVELHSMVSVGPSALSCVVPLRNFGLPAPDPTSTISKATRRGLNIDSIAALIVVKQLWRKRNLSPRGWVILAATAPGRPPLRRRVQGLAVQYFLSLWQQVPTAVVIPTIGGHRQKPEAPLQNK